MTDINLDVDFPHPPERVWRALTDHRLVEGWFARNDLVIEPGTHGQIWPADLPGMTGPIDVEIVDVIAHQQISMVWRADQLHTQVTLAISPIINGTRLSFSQAGFLGSQGTARRRTLRATYDTIFRDRLGAALDSLATGAADLSELAPVEVRTARPRDLRAANDAAMIAAGSAVIQAVEPGEPRGRRRLVAALVAVAVAMLVGIGLYVTVGKPANSRSHSTANDNPGGTATPGGAAKGGGAGSSAGSGSGTPSPMGTPSGAPPTSSPSASVIVSNGSTVPVSATSSSTASVTPSSGGGSPGAPFTATYAGAPLAGGYDGTITVRNVIDRPASQWMVIITLPPDVMVTSSIAAFFNQPPSSPTATFTPDGNDTIPVGGSVTFHFDLSPSGGQLKPLSCQIAGGAACAGL